MEKVYIHGMCTWIKCTKQIMSMWIKCTYYIPDIMWIKCTHITFCGQSVHTRHYVDELYRDNIICIKCTHQTLCGLIVHR